MDFAISRQAAVIVGHLLITTPAVAIGALALFFRHYLIISSPPWPYYMMAAVALAWQWHSAALLRWKAHYSKHGIPETEVDEIARQGGLALPVASIGAFALHTTAAALCASNLDARLTGLWFHWMLPFFGLSGPHYASDARAFYLQHLAIANLTPAFMVGYVACHKYKRLASWAWLLPTMFMAYKLLMFTDPNVSVLTGSHWWSRFSYYFGTNVPNSGNFAPQRFLEQVTIVAFFYSGIAYSLGAVAQKQGIFTRIVASLRRGPTIPAGESELACAVPDKAQK
jgi:hypothetical protein